MRILVTGGSGFLGRHVIDELLKSDFQIRATVHSHPLQQTDSRIEIIKGSLFDQDFIEKAVDGVDAIIHCAAFMSFRKVHKKQMLDLNYRGTQQLVNAAVYFGVKRFVHISSISSMGASFGQGQVSHDFKYNLKPLRINYSFSKYLSDFEVLRGAQEGIEPIILNAGTMLGPGDWRKSNQIYIQYAKLPIRIVPNGGVGFVDVRDVAKVAVKALKKGSIGKRHILIQKNMTYQQFINHFGIKGAINFSVPRLFYRLFGYACELFEWVTRIPMPLTVEKGRLHNFYFWGDGTAAEKEFEFTYTPVEKSISDMLIWYKNGK